MRRFLSRAASSLTAASLAPAARVWCDESAPDGFTFDRSPLHHVFPHLQSRGQAPSPSPVGTLRKPEETHVVRIALTGGPCAGKSSALEFIIKAAKNHGYDVYTAPESATLIFNSGFSCPSNVEGGYLFQQSLARMQLQMERSLTRIAAETGRPSIIIFDRGLLDGKGYMDEACWKRLLTDLGAGGDGRQNGVSEDYLLSRYDAVVHLVTAADGAEKFYKWGETKDDSGNTVIRSEPPEVARAMDKKMQDVWAKHKNRAIVKNGAGGFKEKLNNAADAVLAAAKRKHP